MYYNYQTTICESIFAQMYKILVENVFSNVCLLICHGIKLKIVNNTRIHIFGSNDFHIIVVG